MLNSDSRNRSAVGRIACERGDASVRPPRRPPTMRINSSLTSLAAEAAPALLAPRQFRLAEALGIGRLALRRAFFCPGPFGIIPRWPRNGPRRMSAPAMFALHGPRPSQLAIPDHSRLRTTVLLLWCGRRC